MNKEKGGKRRVGRRLTRKKEKKERRESRAGEKERKRVTEMDPKRIRTTGIKTPEKINEKKKDRKEICFFFIK